MARGTRWSIKKSDVIKYTLDPMVNFIEGVVASTVAAVELTVGAVMAEVITPTISDAIGTGNGVLGSAYATGLAVKGRYIVKCVEAVTDGGIFDVYGPGGLYIGKATVGTAFMSDIIAFSIADGATDFIVGDYFTLDVADGKWEALDTGASDGSQVAAGILITESFMTFTTSTTEDLDATIAVTGPMVLIQEYISGLPTDADLLAVAISQLNAQGFIIKDAY